MAPVVPRMPMVATGVVTVIASGSVLEMLPLMKEKTPCTSEAFRTPVSVAGS